MLSVEDIVVNKIEMVFVFVGDLMLNILCLNSYLGL